MKSVSQILEYILKYKNYVVEKLNKENSKTYSVNSHVDDFSMNTINIALLNGQKAFIEELYKFIVGE